MKSFTAAIPTYKRERDLDACLASILSQSLLPAEVMVIDDDATSAAFLASWTERFAARGVAFAYRKKDHAAQRRGLSESKNLALRLAQGEIIFFFDDDVVLRGGFLKEIMAVWNGAPDPRLLGVGGLIENMRKTFLLERIFNRLFGLTSDSSWDVNDVGFQVWDPDVTEPTRGYFLFGGVSSWRREELAKLGGFAVFSGGRTELEDVDLCLKAKRAGFHMLVLPKAQVLHNESPAARETRYLVGWKQAVNRRETYRLYGLKSLRGRLWFLWASLGWALRQALVLNFRGAAGRVAGLLSRPPAA